MHFTIESITILVTIITTFVAGNHLTENASDLRIKRAAKPKPRITTCVDSRNRPKSLYQPATILQRSGGRLRVTAMLMEGPNPSSIRAPNAAQRRDAQRVISIFRTDRPSGPKIGKTTLKSHGTIRLDEQGAFNEGTYGRFDNYQLQINGNNVPSPSTVAHVNIQQAIDGYTGNKWKQWLDRGLNASLRKGRTVWIFQRVVKPGEQLKCPQQ